MVYAFVQEKYEGVIVDKVYSMCVWGGIVTLAYPGRYDKVPWNDLDSSRVLFEQSLYLPTYLPTTY